MEIRELRIGNYLRCNDIEMSSYFIVNKIDISIISDFIEPITLTEEILLKCGFEKYNHTNYESGYIIEHNEPSKCVYIRTSLKPTSSVFFAVFNRSECNKNEIQFIKKIEYIHDLQNIYKLLTNEELIIQL